MRDEKRIKVILNKIEQIWGQHPDERFYQMMINIGMMNDSYKDWSTEDSDIINHLNDKKQWWNKTKIRKKSKAKSKDKALKSQ